MKRLIGVLFIVFLLVPLAGVEAQPITRVWDMEGLTAAYANGSITLTRSGWGEYIEIGGLGVPSESLNGDKVILTYPFATVELYTIPDKGFEYEMIFASRPANPRVSLPITAPGLTFNIQLPLNQIYTSLEPGWFCNETHLINPEGETVEYRPINVVNSLAVYGEKQNNQYGIGKFTHIYRAMLIDAVGATSWVTMSYEGGYLHFDMDDAWLKSKTRVWPVRLDPTFGTTSIGGSNALRYTSTTYAEVAELTEAGDITTIHLYSHVASGTSTLTCGLYEADDDVHPDDLIATTGTGTITTTPAWVDCSLSPAESAVAAHYGLAHHGSANWYTYYDDVFVANTGHADGGTFPDPWSCDSHLSRRQSIYATYTVGAGNNPPNAPLWVSPANNTRYDPGEWCMFNWTFSDPDGGDTQGAYELEIDNDIAFGSPEVDTGKQSSSNGYHNVTALPTTLSLYYVRIRTWDDSDAEGSWNSSKQIIVDRVNITLSVVDGRISIGETATINAAGVFHYDGASWSGAATLNDTKLKNVVGLYNYTTTSITDPTHGLTNFTSNSVSVIFDQINITSITVTDSRINAGATGVLTPSGVHVYDSSVWNGTATYNDTLTKSAVGLYVYSVSSVTDTDYGVTNFTQFAANPSIIFDKIKVLTLEVNATSVSVGEWVMLNASLELEYDHHTLGSGDTVNFTYSESPPSSWNAGTSRFEENETRATDAVVTYNLITANEATYGITAVNMNGKTVTVTWGTPGSFIIYIVDRFGSGISGAFIVVWDDGNLTYAVTTNSTGHYDFGPVSNDNYTIQATADSYQSSINTYNVAIPELLTVTLQSIEDGIMFNMELLIFSAVSILFMGLAVFGESLNGMVGAAGGFFSWFTTGLWFWYQQAGASTSVFFYFFNMLALVCVILFYQHFTHFSFLRGKKGKWEAYEE